MSNRFILDEDGLRWDRVIALDIEGHPILGLKPTISVTGIVNGKDGAVFLHLPGTGFKTPPDSPLSSVPTVGTMLLVAPGLDISAKRCTVQEGLSSPSPFRRCRRSRPWPTSQAPRTRYRSIIADSGRWDGFAFRPGDVVISTPSKCGTTWMQMLCALLIFDGPEFPAPLDEVSPWLDMCTRPLAEVTAALAAQTHRRFIKTHTPLDGLPLHADVTYLVVGRDPRDVAISLEHHVANMDFERFLELRAAAVGNEDLAELPERRVPSEDPVERFRTFVADETPGRAPADARLGAASPRHGLAASARSERRPLPLRRLAGRPRG